MLQAEPFIDGHVHLNDPAMQIDLMNEHKIPKAVVTWGRNSSNDSVLAALSAHPDRFLPFVSVSPERERYRAMWINDDPALLEELDNSLATGKFKGIGEISVVHFPGRGFPEADFDLLSPTMRGIMALAGQYRLPVMIHCEITQIAAFSALLETYPDIQVIWAHGGYTPYFLARRMLKRHPNLTYELSARTWARHPRSPEYTIFRDQNTIWPRWLRLIEENPDRFIVGTDASHHSLRREQNKIKSVQLLLRQLDPGVRRKVSHDNLLKLVGETTAN